MANDFGSNSEMTIPTKSTEKYCVNCRWYVVVGQYNSKTKKSEDQICCRPLPNDLVTGNSIPVRTRKCSSERYGTFWSNYIYIGSGHERCGQSGSYYEPKE